jgi:two-component system, NarL family, sensor kinase
MTPPAVLVSLALVGLSLAAGGVLLDTRRARPSGSLMALAGAALAAATVLEATDRPGVAGPVYAASAALFLPLALATYPRPRWRGPVDFVALSTITAAGALTVARWSDEATRWAMGLTIGLGLIAYTWFRIETTLADERRTLAWLALAAGIPASVAGLLLFLAPTTASAVIGFGVFAAVGPAMYVGVALPDVVDVRGLLVRSVVFAVVAVVYVAGFVTLESLLEMVGGAVPQVGVLAVTGLATALTVHPLQVVLRGVMDELLFGRRPDPLGAASRVAARVGDDPALAVRAIREALVLPYVAVTVAGLPVAASGTSVTHTRRLPLDLGDGGPGELVVGLRAGDLRLTAGDEHVLQLVGPLLARTLRANALAADLQVSRRETITRLEEERRRLRRDLHDGLGPRLSGIAFTADAARNRLASDPAGADALLVTVRAETATAIEEIRRLVYAMRPPALDELGLVPALRQQATVLRAASGDPLHVTITGGPLPEGLSAAVEVAAYRIVMEALTNVARHSGGRTAEVRLGADHAALTLNVQDDGPARAGPGGGTPGAGTPGAPAEASGGGTPGPSHGAWEVGVGISSMRERAEELGGVLTAGSNGSGGHVHAVLPLVRPLSGRAD